MTPLSLKRFGKLVVRVLETLPEEFRPHLDNVVVDVEDAPDVETLQEQGFTAQEIADGESLYGLFVPMPVPSDWGGDVLALHSLPHRIIIYKRPLEEDFPDRRQLREEIRKTVIHELAHHFGYSDRDLERWTDVY